jgi:hypothetical protein
MLCWIPERQLVSRPPCYPPLIYISNKLTLSPLLSSYPSLHLSWFPLTPLPLSHRPP